MSDIQNETNQESQPEERTVLQIILSKDGEVRVRGVLLSDEVACYGLLKKAEQIIAENHQAARVKLVKPNGGIMSFIRNGRK